LSQSMQKGEKKKGKGKREKFAQLHLHEKRAVSRFNSALRKKVVRVANVFKRKRRKKKERGRNPPNFRHEDGKKRIDKS